MGGQTSKPLLQPATCEKSCEKQDVPLNANDILAGIQSVQLSCPTELTGALNTDAFVDWERAVSDDPAKRLARTVLSKEDIWTALRSPKAAIADQHVFNLKVSIRVPLVLRLISFCGSQITHNAGKVTDQENTGRCWVRRSVEASNYS